MIEKNNKKLDPITSEIIQNTLVSVCDEMFIAMRKTAMSPIIYEVLDFAVAVTNPKGELASAGAGIPAFINMCDFAVKAVLKKYDLKDINEGDIFATNDPYNGGVTHLNDVIVVLPVFYNNKLVAWTCNMAHWPDLGGIIPGGISSDSTEIFQEGLQIPVIKMFESGKINQSIEDMILANTRVPQYTKGDMWAAIASVRIGEKRIKEVAKKYGVESTEEAIKQYFDYGEEASLKALEKLPKGTFYGEDLLDDGKKIKVEITISEKEFIVNFKDNPPQNPDSNNASFDGIYVAAQMAFKNITTMNRVANAGFFRPLKVYADEGSMFNPKRPAAQGLYYETDIRAYDLLLKTIAQIVPDKMIAGTFASVCGTIMAGVHPDTGATFVMIEPEIGGWGASNEEDGLNAMYSTLHGDTYNTPSEVAEARNGIYVDQVRLSNEDGGEGKFRGGKGIVMDYRVRSDGTMLTAFYSRSVSLPWSLKGGNEGSANFIEIIKENNSIEKISNVNGLILNKNDIIRIHTANGAGYGNPLERDKKLIEEDIKNEYITEEQAEKFYNFKKN